MDEDAKKTERVQLLMTAAEVAAIDEWSFTHRVRGRSEAIRQLIERGLAAPIEHIPAGGAGPTSGGAPDSDAVDDAKPDAGKRTAPPKPTASASNKAASKEAQLRAMREARQ